MIYFAIIIIKMNYNSSNDRIQLFIFIKQLREEIFETAAWESNCLSILSYWQLTIESTKINK